MAATVWLTGLVLEVALGLLTALGLAGGHGRYDVAGGHGPWRCYGLDDRLGAGGGPGPVYRPGACSRPPARRVFFTSRMRHA